MRNKNTFDTSFDNQPSAKKSLKAKLSNPRFKHGSFATAITAVVIVLVILLNAAVTILGNRVDLRFDITSNKLFSLTDEAKAYFEAVNEDVTINVLSSENDLKTFSVFSDQNYNGGIYEIPIRRLPEIFSQLEKNEHITVRYVDIDSNPTFLNKYNLVSVPSKPEMYILVESAKRHKLVDLTEFINTDFGEASSYSQEELTYYYFTEQPLVNAFGYVLRDEIVSATFINGHGEKTEGDSGKTYFNAFSQYFANNGLEVNMIDFLKEEIPENTKFLVMVSPTRDMTDEEIVKLDEFLQSGKDYGKNLLYFDSGKKVHTNLYSYLELNWGVKLDPNSRVYDDKNCIYLPYRVIANYNSDSDILTDLVTENIKTVLTAPSPIEILWEERDIRTVTSLLTSADSSFMRPYDDSTVVEDVTKQDTDITGSYSLMTLSRKRNQNLPVEESSSVLVTSDGYWAETLVDNYNSFGNAALLTSVLEAMQEKSDPVTIIKKDLMTEVITLSAKQIKTFALIFSLGATAIIVTICITVFVRRKNL